MYQKKLLWLLCATIVTCQPVFAQNAANIKLDGKPLTAVAVASAKPKGFTLDDAIAKALAQSPRLKAFNSGVAAAKGEQRQAGAWQNPEISYTNENFGGGAAYKAISPQQNSFGVTQLIEVGGKISARENIAGKGVEIASLDEQAAKLDIIREVTTAYADAVAAEENVRLASEQKDLAEDVLKSVSIRVAAAAAPLIQKSRAEVERSTATIALDTAMREREITQKNLATLLGEERVMFTLDSRAFYVVTKPDIAGIEEKLKVNPNLVKLGALTEQSKARLDLEKANAIPDPRFTVGMIDIPSARDRAFMVGVSLPIPVFNANRGNIEKARNEVSRTEFENHNAVLTINADLTRAQQQMENAYLRAETLKHEVLPSAEKAFTLARHGYELGRFPYLEVLDAQRSLFTVKQQQITALKEYHAARAMLERLSAIHAARIDIKGESK
ncbi:MAG: TolC family protein [Alphaproteobacteria bacterium]|nr:MAG: TolC family protein [Alphaproteobacteria bacterium]TAF40070.1 MAG: TolC family protein [Alphaproteobacteria bacterium]TAF74811.1 MAG: TolC family protein [Alphaproteobacteria bacterium]